MGAPTTGMQTGEQASAEALLGAFKTIKAAERRKHASVLNYWLSIRGDKEFPPLHDLDPLELSDAGPHSALLELISGGHDAEIRHVGEALRGGQDWPERIMDAPSASILGSIAKKLPIVAISRDFLAFEDEFTTDEGATRCWVTLLPLSAGGAWVDYVYALVSFDSVPVKGFKPAEKAAKSQEEAEVAEQIDEATEETETVPEAAQLEEPAEAVIETHDEPEDEVVDESPAEVVQEAPQKSDKAKPAPGFSKLFDSLAGLTGFHAQSVKVEPVLPETSAEAEDEDEVSAPVEDTVEETPADVVVIEDVAEELPVEAEVEEPADAVEEEAPVAEVAEEEAVAPEVVEEESSVVEVADDDEPVEEPVLEQVAAVAADSEGPLHDRLSQVRTMADEAKAAQMRAKIALYEGVSAAYDFALDAEECPEEYLRLVEAQGLKIQLRSPMKPVAKLAFDGLCDDATIKQVEAVLAWAFEHELERGTLVEQIREAGGIPELLGKTAKAA